MKRLRITGFLAAVLLLASCMSKNIRFGTAAEGGVYYSLGTLLASDAKTEGLTVNVRPTAGSMANLRLLSKGYIQAGIAQSDQIALNYFNETEPLQGYSTVASLYTEPIQIIVRADSEFKSVEDLEGGTVSIGQVESGTEANAVDVLRSYGLMDNSIRLMHLSYAEACTALENKTIDAMFLTSGAPAVAIRELSSTTQVRLLSLNEKVMTRLQNIYPYYTKTVISKDTYQGMDEDAVTLGIRAIFLASDSLSKDSVYQLTKLLFDHADSYSSALGVDISLNQETVLQAVTVPLHPGAVKYYQEIGIDTEFLDNR